MKTFGDIKKGDKLYIVNEGTAIPGGVEILEHEALTDYGEIFGPDGKSLDPFKGVTVKNPFGGDLPLSFNAEETKSGMYYTTVEEAVKGAIEKMEQHINSLNNELNGIMTKMFETHQNVILANLKKQQWENWVKISEEK